MKSQSIFRGNYSDVGEPEKVAPEILLVVYINNDGRTVREPPQLPMVSRTANNERGLLFLAPPSCGLHRLDSGI